MELGDSTFYKQGAIVDIPIISPPFISLKGQTVYLTRQIVSDGQTPEVYTGRMANGDVLWVEVLTDLDCPPPPGGVPDQSRDLL